MKLATPRQKFFDFYSIIELYLKCGGYREIGYLSYSTFVSHKIESFIAQQYEKIVDSFFDEIRNALIHSIKSELTHFRTKTHGPHYLSFYERYNVYKHFKKINISKEMIVLAKKFPGDYPEIAHALFTKISWFTSYGGRKWGRGTQLLMELKSVKTSMDKIYWVDRVLDLYHNNGHMIDKTKFKVLSKKMVILSSWTGRKKKVTPLDLRANAKTILDFLPFNSMEMQRLVIPRKNLLTQMN